MWNSALLKYNWICVSDKKYRDFFVKFFFNYVIIVQWCFEIFSIVYSYWSWTILIQYILLYKYLKFIFNFIRLIYNTFFYNTNSVFIIASWLGSIRYHFLKFKIYITLIIYSFFHYIFFNNSKHAFPYLNWIFFKIFAQNVLISQT